MVTTFDPETDRPTPACLALDKFVEESKDQVTWKVDNNYGPHTPAQIVCLADIQSAGMNDDPDTILNEIDKDDISFVHAGKPAVNAGDATSGYRRELYDVLNFNYRRVFNLYQFSENLEQWCRGVTQFVRNNPEKFYNREGDPLNA